MTIVTTEVAAYREDLWCDDCTEIMRYTGERLLTNPPKHVHECPKCKKRIGARVSYPRIIHKEKSDDAARSDHQTTGNH